MDKVIGYLLDGKTVVAPDRLRGREGAPLYAVNVGQYRQTCHETGAVLNVGVFEAELFPKTTNAKGIVVEREEEPDENAGTVIAERPKAAGDLPF